MLIASFAPWCKHVSMAPCRVRKQDHGTQGRNVIHNRQLSQTGQLQEIASARPEVPLTGDALASKPLDPHEGCANVRAQPASIQNNSALS